jgi:hypothetical protein
VDDGRTQIMGALVQTTHPLTPRHSSANRWLKVPLHYPIQRRRIVVMSLELIQIIEDGHDQAQVMDLNSQESLLQDESGV